MRRCLAAIAATLALGAAFVWGCAHQEDAPRPHDWQHYVPDGGWVNYVPVPDPYEPHPMEAAAGIDPHISTIPVPWGNPLVH